MRVEKHLCRAGEESGRIALLTIGFLAIVLLIGLTVISASSIHLQRKSVQSLTETLAVRAASAVDDEAYVAAQRGRPEVTRVVAEKAIARHLELLGEYRPPNFTVSDVTITGRTIEVRTRAVAAPPFLGDRLWPVTVTARAQALIVGAQELP
ncbi:MAG: hypothetical protein Q4B12_04575 [Bowdeniella nasicola]|nr:hypothetical protein [Bowdeniella nasicola]